MVLDIRDVANLRWIGHLQSTTTRELFLIDLLKYSNNETPIYLTTRCWAVICQLRL